MCMHFQTEIMHQLILDVETTTSTYLLHFCLLSTVKPPRADKTLGIDLKSYTYNT